MPWLLASDTKEILPKVILEKLSSEGATHKAETGEDKDKSAVCFVICNLPAKACTLKIITLLASLDALTGCSLDTEKTNALCTLVM